MPTASDSVRDLMQKWFGSLDADGPWRFLQSHGYTMEKWVIKPPTSSHGIHDYEFWCIIFLCDEWDWDMHWPTPLATRFGGTSS